MTDADSLVGLWFHSRTGDGEVHWQGQVLRSLPAERLIVQLYEWGMGELSTQKTVSLEDTSNWDFYMTNADMRLVSEKEREKERREKER